VITPKLSRFFQRALKIYEKALGPDHPDTATARNNLGELYRSMGDYTKAKPLLKRALKMKWVRCPVCGALHYTTPSEVERGYWICGFHGGVDTEFPIEPVEEYQETMPKFPWPPPKASASDTVSRQLLLGSREHLLLGDAAAALDLAFRKAGYGEKSFYGVPDGFAMASRIEQMNQDGTSLEDPADRWSLKVPPIRKFSFSAYMTALFRARPGYYRVIVFVVTSHLFSQSGAEITSDDAKRWSSSGLNGLPDDIASRDYTSAYRCTALIYEFKRMETQRAEFVDPSEITGQIHLEKAGLLAALSQR
jgi:tetratricopeptide (TPR) repeat protein